MNYLKHAYADGVKHAFQKHALNPPTPSANTASPTSAPAMAQRGRTQNPALTPNPAGAVSQSTADATRGGTTGARGTGGPTEDAPRGYSPTGTTMKNPGSPVASASTPPPPIKPAANVSRAKASEFNMEMYPDPRSQKDERPSPDNGRRLYGTQFSDALRPLRDVDQAFNGLNIQKNTDVLNSAGQAEFGTPRG